MWDKFKMAQLFLQRANAIHPEEIDDVLQRVDAMARQDLLYDCYMSSFSRKDLIKRLGEVIEGRIEVPAETDMDEARYRQTYIREARLTLSSIENDKLT